LSSKVQNQQKARECGNCDALQLETAQRRAPPR